MPAPSRRRRPQWLLRVHPLSRLRGQRRFYELPNYPEIFGHLKRLRWLRRGTWPGGVGFWRRAGGRSPACFPAASRRLHTVPPAYIRLFYPTCTAASRGLRALGISESDFFLKPFRNTSAPCIWFPLKNLLRTAMIASQKAWRRVPPDRASFPHPLVISYIRRALLSSFSERHGKKISIGKWGGKGPSSGRSKAGCRLRGIMGDPESVAGRGRGGAGEISV